MKHMDFSDPESIMRQLDSNEGFDMTTSPAANAGAPFTGTPPASIQANNVNDDLFSPLFEGENASSEDDDQMKSLESFMDDFVSTEDDGDFVEMIKNLVIDN